MLLWCKLLFIILRIILTNAEILIDNDGGYKNIVVGITPELPESKIESLLFQLEALFRSTSSGLKTASRGNVYFKEIVFAIPKKYKNWLSKKTLFTGAQYFKNPDIFLTENDIFTNPYTVQHSGCGRPGLRIHIPRDFLTLTSFTKASSLVRQWAHYRYGVFDESGFSNDEVYPACYRIPGSETIKVSDCTNEKAVYEFRKDNNADYERFPSVCTPIPTNGQNNHIVSSLMTNIDFPKMSYFCDNESRSHNRNAPTKQNALCGEKSIWDIISRHDDFKIKGKASSNVKPSFKYVIESDPRIIVAVDSSQNMEQNGRMDLTRNAFSYFMFYDLPRNSTVGLLNMKNNDINPVLTNIQTDEDAERLVDTFPEVYGYGDICVYCSIQRVLEVLKLDITDIIVITATDIEEKWVDNTATMLKSNRVGLHVIYFQKKLQNPAFLESVARSSGGNFFYIAEAFPPGSSVSSLTLVYEAFRSIHESFSWVNRNRVLIDQMTFSNNCSPKCVLSFPSDRSIESFQVLITGPEFIIGPPVLRDSIVLKNSNESFVPGDDTFAYKPKIPVYMFTIVNPQPQLWNLTFERKPGYNKPIIVAVRATNRRYNDILSMNSWISVDKDKNVEISRRPPITIYSEIKKNNNPVGDAEVTAFVHQASYNKEMSLTLNDSGEGDPDITKNDGIFSRYLTDIEQAGYYSLTIVAEKQSSEFTSGRENAHNSELNCCGSFIPAHLTYNTGSFKRVTTYQSFFVNNQNANIIYPPRRVMDLRVDKIEILKNNIKCYILKWTAPGDNYDKGKASSYDLRVFNAREDAQNDFDNKYVLVIKMLNIQGPILEPKEAGTIQTAHVELINLRSGTYFIALKATSHLLKTSDVSNIVEVSYINESTLFTDVGLSKISPNTFPGDGTTETITDNDTSATLSSTTSLAIGLSCGILLLLFIIGLILCVYFASKKRINSTSNPSHNTKKTESNDALCKGNGPEIISIISPVNSWAADSLITHYETLQKNKNRENNGIVTAASNKETDSMSITSSKYSYDNKIDQNSVIYDPIYFHEVRSQEELNYPYNSAYTPFNPIYTSSLRRFNNGEVLGIPSPAENASLYNTTERYHLSKLKTDV